jgi:hypothetical protein
MRDENSIDFNSFFLDAPLYSGLDLKLLQIDDALNIVYHSTNHFIYGKIKVLDSFCPVCNAKTTFISNDSIDENLDKLSRVNSIKGSWIEKNNELIKEMEKIGSFQRVFHCP